MPGSPRYPALAAWRRELAAGARTRETFDPLWRAACAEQNAAEAAAMGLPRAAADYSRDARLIIDAARKALRKGVA